MSRLRAVRSAAGSVRQALGLLWQVSAARTLAWTGATAIDAVVPAATAYAAKRIVDAVVAGDEAQTLLWVGVELGLVALRSITYHLRDWWQFLLGSRLGLFVESLIIEKARDLALWHFEDADQSDVLARAAKEAGSRPLHLVRHSLESLRATLSLGSYAALLFTWAPASVLVVAAGTLPQLWAQGWQARQVFAVQQARTHRERRTGYLREVLVRDQFVSELKLFALGRWLAERYFSERHAFVDEDARVMARTTLWTFAARMVATATFYVCYAWVARSAVRGEITLGDMTMLLMALRGAQDTFESLLNALGKIHEDDLYMDNLRSWLSQPSDEPFEPLDPAMPPPTPIEVRLEGVGFTYPGTQRAVLRDIDLTLHRGETLALVGPNGAGKSTLVKLLTRLYEPTSGGIWLDDVPSTQDSPGAVRQRMAVVRQDFVQWQLSARDNVGAGHLLSREQDPALLEAIDRAGAEDVLARLPDGLESWLGRAYGGAQLSVGQWQKLALARAFVRPAGLLILDEPSAALDPKSELELFSRMVELTHDRTTLLITHRFSTVRYADRIAVLDQGQLVELGTHHELIALGGLYHELFTAQAQAYDVPGDDEPG